jgi:hypothetical protein
MLKNNIVILAAVIIVAQEAYSQDIDKKARRMK